jgi:hypothetical protein
MTTTDSFQVRFAGRTLGVATMHGKERAVGPILQRTLGLSGFVVLPGIDTDRFGSFSGEVQRTLDPLNACIAKARHGAEVSGLDLVIASEGSFGPYPPAPFVSCDEEFLALYDARDDRLFTHRHVSLETMFGGEAVHHPDEALAFGTRMGFPDHHLVLRPHKVFSPGDTLHKGVSDHDALVRITTALLDVHRTCWVESDLRAMANPTRMRVIEATAQRFADELQRACPYCGACWFRITGSRSGLPCGFCGTPTASTRSYVRSCWKCLLEMHEPRPDGKETEEQQYCPICNP